jgi:hypothetical protein
MIWKMLLYFQDTAFSLLCYSERKFAELESLTPIVAVGLKATLKYIVSPFDIPPCMHVQLTISDILLITSTENER